MKRVLTLLTLFCATATIFAAAEIGKPTPDFTGTDINGKTHRLADYRGKIIVLEAYNLDCPFSRNHYKTGAMQQLQADLTGKGVVWLTINSSNPKSSSHRTKEAAQKEWKEQKMKGTAWIDDSSGTIGKAYGMRTTPHMFVIGKEGSLAYQGAIDDRAESEGDPRNARNYVRDAVDALLAGKKVPITQTKPYGCGVKY